MNGAASQRGYGFDTGRPPAGVPDALSRKNLVDGYRKDNARAAVEQIGGRTNGARVTKADEPPSSSLVDLKDPIQIHLLTETALSDSKSYEILSQEEVDDLRKQVQTLTMRIEQARTNLAIQTKYRDAAVSMAKLYTASASRPGSKRSSFLSNRQSGAGAESAREAQLEKEASERRCEELAAELFDLEKRLMIPQRKLLEHTAGILKLTHRAASRDKVQHAPAGQPMPNGIPGSPESLYTYTNPRNSLDPPDEDLFDNGGLYLDGARPREPRPRKNSIEIPLKSPIRTQQPLREELARVKEENARLKRDQEQLGAETASLRTRSEGQVQTIADTERQLEGLNGRLKELIIKINPANTAAALGVIPAAGAGDTILQQLDSLGKGLSTALEEHIRHARETMGARESAVAAAAVSAAADLARLEGQAQASEQQRLAAERDLQGVQQQLQDTQQQMRSDQQQLQDTQQQNEQQQQTAEQQLQAAERRNQEAEAQLQSVQGQLRDLNLLLLDTLQANGNLAEVPNVPPDSGMAGQVESLRTLLVAVKGELARAANLSSSASSNKQNAVQMEAVLMGLWDIIQAGYAEIIKQHVERKKLRMQQGLGDDEDDDGMSGPESPGMVDVNEPYSLQAFSSKVQWLFAQATSLAEQKSVLKRQVKQQRELSNKGTSEKDQEIRAGAEALGRVQGQLVAAEKNATESRDKLTRTLAELDSLQRTTAANDEMANQAAKGQLAERNAKIASLEASTQDLRAQLEAAQAGLGGIKARLDQAEEAKAAAEAETARLQKAAAEKEAELERMNMMVIELKTELTFAKAELDGAYGSRAQRAADMAAAAAAAGKSVDQAEVDRLKGELTATVAELQALTKETVAIESEKARLEDARDAAVAARAELEAERRKLDTQVARLQEQLDAEKLKVPPSPRPGMGGNRAGATMLSEQFRASMKEERKKFQEELREEQMKRRKLEDELRGMRRSQGPGPSSLGLLK